MVGGVVDDDPAVVAVLGVGAEVAAVRPEEGVSLRGRPHALDDVVRDVRVLGQPLHHLARLQCGWAKKLLKRF